MGGLCFSVFLNVILGTKQYFLKALSHHLKYVPKEALLPELPNVSVNIENHQM